jgi:hypothetical protein
MRTPIAPAAPYQDERGLLSSSKEVLERRAQTGWVVLGGRCFENGCGWQPDEI